jgi:hypothetical protein
VRTDIGRNASFGSSDEIGTAPNKKCAREERRNCKETFQRKSMDPSQLRADSGRSEGRRGDATGRTEYRKVGCQLAAKRVAGVKSWPLR